MVFKNFRINCILRVILITLTILGSVGLLLFTSFYITSGLVFFLAVLQTFLLIEYVEKTNMKLARLISSIENEDFAIHFTDNRKGFSFRELSNALNRVVQHFSNSKREREEALFYLETVMQHSPVALIAFDANSRIQFFNKAASDLTGIKKPETLDDLDGFETEIIDVLKQSTELSEFSVKNYALRITRFGLYGDMITLVSIQNINKELNEKESDSWHKLLRVLTHEIMNSVTPIASIAATGEKISQEYDAQNAADITKAFETIKRRGENLLHFTSAYRSFSNLPKAEIERVKLYQVVNSVLDLLSHRFSASGVTVQNETNNFLEILADRKLAEQVLINVVLNALEALTGTENPKIEISTIKKLNKIQLVISDNGPGIPLENLDKIFIPFFTTKTKGSGIGLSLSRELMKLQNGNLAIHSTEGHGAVAKLIFAESA